MRLIARPATWGAVVLALVLCLWWVTRRPLDRAGPVYSVPALRLSLERHPDAWIGRVVAVRGVVPVALPVYLCAPAQDPCPDATATYFLADALGGRAAAGSAPISVSIPLVLGQPDPTLAPLRHIPLIGHLLPAPQILHLTMVATYRVRVKNALSASSLCRVAPCPILQLIDAARPAHREGR